MGTALQAKKKKCIANFSFKLKDKKTFCQTPSESTFTQSLFSSWHFEQMFSLKVWRILLYNSACLLYQQHRSHAVSKCFATECVNMCICVVGSTFCVQFTQRYKLLTFTWSWLVFPWHGCLSVSFLSHWSCSGAFTLTAFCSIEATPKNVELRKVYHYANEQWCNQYGNFWLE